MFKQPLPVLLASLGLIALAQSAAAQTPSAQTASCTPSLADKVALNPVAGSNLMTVPVAINGTQKQFLLDIGSNPDEISEAAVAELHLAEIDQRSPANAMATINSNLQFQPPMVDVRGAVRTPQAQVRVPSFTLGTATLSGIGFLVSTDRDLGRAKPYDGLLTAAGFRQYDMDLDFAGRQLSFLAPTTCADPGQVAHWPHSALAVISITMPGGNLSGGKIGIPVTIAGHAIAAVIDTGSDRTVMRRAVAERLFGLKADTPDMTAVDDLRDGAGERVYQHAFPQITFEGVTAGNVPALIEANSMVRRARRPITGSRLPSTTDSGPPIPDLTLGMDVLRQLHIYAAFGQNKLYVTPAG